MAKYVFEFMDFYSMQLSLLIPALAWGANDAISGFSRQVKTTNLNKIFTYAQKIQVPDMPLSVFYRQHLPTYNELDYFRQANLIPNKPGQFLVCPINLQAHLSHVSLNDSVTLSITLEEAQAICKDLNVFLHEDGWHFSATSPTLWVLTTHKPLDSHLPPPYDLDREHIQHTPNDMGTDAKYIQKINCDIQTFLFSHSVNQKRRQEGNVAINSLWIFPPNQNSTLIASQINQTQFYVRNSFWQTQFSSKPIPNNLQTWYKMAIDNPKIQHTILLDNLLMPVRYQDLYSYQQALLELEADFFTPAYTLIKMGQLKNLTIHCHGAFNGSFSLTRRSLLSFWKKKQKFNGYIA